MARTNIRMTITTMVKATTATTMMANITKATVMVKKANILVTSP